MESLNGTQDIGIDVTLLGKDVVEAKIAENQNNLLEAIKNEYTIPSLLVRVTKEIEKIKQKGKDVDSKDKNAEFLTQTLSNNLKGLEGKKLEMESELEFNKENIQLYQKYIKFLQDLLPNLK